MMSIAKYTLLIATRDELGRSLQLSTAAHQYIVSSNLRVEGSTVANGDPYDQLSIWTEDNPESDSTMKQLAIYIGELANLPSVTVTKEGNTGATWQMRNPHYMPQQGADPSAMIPQVSDMNTNMAPDTSYMP